MDTIRDILVIVDPTAADQPAVEKSRILASKLHATVGLLGCETISVTELRLARQMRARGAYSSTSIQAWLESLAEPLRSSGIEVTTNSIKGDPLDEAVLAWMQNSPADLVVKDTHHHSWTKRTFLANTDWHLIRECPLPLLLTKPTRWTDPPVFAAAIDPRGDTCRDALDNRIVACALSISRSMHAALHTVHAYYPEAIMAASSCPEPNYFSVTTEMLDAEKALHQATISSLLEPFAIAPEFVHVDMGFAADYLPRIAEQYRVDIMVMGAISRSHLKQTLIGSTAERLLEYLPCDVLVVKDANFGECRPL